MRQYPVIIMLGIITLLIASSCQDAKSKEVDSAIKASDAWLSRYTYLGSEANEFWGITVDSIWGPACPISGRVLSHLTWQNWLNSPQPFTYQTKYTCWLNGKSPSGDPVSISREIVAIIAPNGPGWKIQSYEFRNERALTIGAQIFAWLLWSYVWPIIMLFLLTSVVFYYTGSGFLVSLSTIWAIARFITSILILPWIGWVSFACFNSCVAIAVGIIVYLAIYILLVAKLLDQIVRRQIYST